MKTPSIVRGKLTGIRTKRAMKSGDGQGWEPHIITVFDLDSEEGQQCLFSRLDIPEVFVGEYVESSYYRENTLYGVCETYVLTTEDGWNVKNSVGYRR